MLVKVFGSPLTAGSPRYPAKVRNVVKVTVTADDRLAVLPRQSGDPDVVLWNRPPLLAQIVPHLRVGFGCSLVDRQDEGFSDEDLQEPFEMAAAVRAAEPIEVLTDDDDREVVLLISGEYLAQSGVTSKKIGNGVSV